MSTNAGVPTPGMSKAEQITQDAAAIADVAYPEFAPYASAAVMVEPVVESLVKAILSLFHHHKQVVAALTPPAAPAPTPGQPA